MIYPQNFEQKTGFDKVRRLISEKCLSPLGEERVAEMGFSADYQTVTRRLEQTDEFVRILHGEDEFPASYFFDVRYSLKRIRPEGTWLDEKELFDLKRSLQTINDIIRFFRPSLEEKEEIKYPALTALAGDILVFPQLIGKIDAILDKFGRVKDNASPTLAQIRKEITATMSGISRSLQSILRAAQSEGVVDKDITPTMRDGRLMIPVAPAFKRKIKGIVHDESASGKTVFIEPEVVVEANNRIRELEGDERREIMKILTEFTNFIRPLVPDILQSYEFLAEIDFIRAKALFAEQVNGIKPVVEDKQQIDWIRAAHPLLFLSLQKQNKQIVPLDILLEEKKRLLIISGPNAGGKSVCLQTAGLLQYMFQCGIPVPVEESSKFGIFHKILIDMGDEQSLENDLSTYSSHLVNMKNFIRYASQDTLILIDEFGTGTEPMLGGAIAEAILNALNNNQTRGVITTHYTNLKHFASSAPGIANGAMLYDSHRMLPLFQLEIGKPGSSFAFEIAKKIGLPKEILDDAASKIGEDRVNFDKHLKEILRDKRYWEEKRKRIHENEKRLEEVLERYKKELDDASKLRKTIIQEAQEKAKELISGANKTIENTIRQIKESQAEKEQTRLARQTFEEEKRRLLASEEEEEERLKRKIEKLKNREKKQKEKGKRPQASFPEEAAQQGQAPTFNKGDLVQLDNKAVGEIIEINEKNAVIALGGLMTTVKVERLSKISNSAAKKITQNRTPRPSSNYLENISQKRMDFKPEIDVRGLRGDEALMKVSEFIDNAVMLNMKDLRILHGTGTGALRQIIRDFLKTNPVVGSCGDEHVQMGGSGITVVKLDI